MLSSALDEFRNLKFWEWVSTGSLEDSLTIFLRLWHLKWMSSSSALTILRKLRSQIFSDRYRKSPTVVCSVFSSQSQIHALSNLLGYVFWLHLPFDNQRLQGARARYNIYNISRVVSTTILSVIHCHEAINLPCPSEAGSVSCSAATVG